MQLGSSQQNDRSPKQKTERLHLQSWKSQNSRIESKPGGRLGLAVPLKLMRVKSADFYPQDSCFQYFLVFLAWMPWNIATINVWKPGSHCSQKSPKLPLCNFLTFFLILFAKFPVDCVKMSFQIPNKGGTCFKHYNFLYFDKTQLPQKILVPWSFKLA